MFLFKRKLKSYYFQRWLHPWRYKLYFFIIIIDIIILFFILFYIHIILSSLYIVNWVWRSHFWESNEAYCIVLYCNTFQFMLFSHLFCSFRSRILDNIYHFLFPEPPSCAPDKYRCTNGSCIPIAWYCDDTKDCDDGSDENNCRKCLIEPCDSYNAIMELQASVILLGTEGRPHSFIQQYSLNLCLKCIKVYTFLSYYTN